MQNKTKHNFHFFSFRLFSLHNYKNIFLSFVGDTAVTPISEKMKKVGKLDVTL